MCSGRVDLSFVFKAFLNGMDGVFIGGCRLNECNYITHGNYHALNMVLLSKRILHHMGINPDRLRIEFMSSGEGILFAQLMNEFSKQIKDIGPLAQAEGLNKEELRERIKDVIRLVPYIKMAKRDKLEARVEAPEQYDSYFTDDEIDKLFKEVPSYYIDPDKCQACMICFRRCPVEAISGAKNTIHVIDQEKCIKCGTCLDACPSRFGAVNKIVGEEPPAPIPEDKRLIVRKTKAS